MFNADERKSGSARRFCCERLSDSVNSYTLEVSMCGFQLKGTQVVTQYTEEDCEWNIRGERHLVCETDSGLFSTDMRFGRNIIRTLLEYYRFTNVLNIPMMTELRRKKPRPKTHRSRSKVRYNNVIKPRPKTTRSYAPISYTDLTMHYDNSSTSNEGSPTRSYGGFGSRSTGNIYVDIHHTDQHQRPDQYSLLAIRSSKFNALEFPTNEFNKLHIPKHSSPPSIRYRDDNVSIPPKPSLSIIDFNQLTRGGLDRAKRNESRNKKLASKTA